MDTHTTIIDLRPNTTECFNKSGKFLLIQINFGI